MKVTRILMLAPALLAACSGSMWNNPYPAADSGRNILYSAFQERPKHLDPVQSYSSNEVVFTAQVYEPPLQYHFLKRPYTLIPLTASEIPRPKYYDAAGRPVPDNADARDIAASVYEITIKPGIRYQPHPAFARDDSGRPLYQDLKAEDLKNIYTLQDFPQSGTRELVAGDYVYEIKRLASPRLQSPILGLMSGYIVGLKEYAENLRAADAGLAKSGRANAYLDLTQYPLAGAEVVSRYTYRVKLKGKYPQFLYWLAMPFFAPVPPEADRFYSQPGMAERNIVLDWYPVGTGAYMLSENNPNQRMVLEKNPNFHGETYPGEGAPEDRGSEMLVDAGKALPIVDRAVFSLEKESIPYWNKFLQGFYDSSGISSDTFDQAIQFGRQGDVQLTDDMQNKGITLSTSVAPSTFYMGFNMLDPVVGGESERARKLRLAISIAVDEEEYITIFANGRGVAAQGPIAPGIFGYREGEEGINAYVYEWANGRARRKTIDDAQKLLAEAGYPNGRDSATGHPLSINFDVTARGPDDKARLDWLRKQFQKLNIDLVVRATDYNRFQDKVRKGDAQVFQWGWNADYPDPENFLFLLHGPEGKVKYGGENAVNYANPEYDKLFEKMKDMDSGPEREAVIDRMVEIVRHDAPWAWGMHPKDYVLSHGWVFNRKPNQIANNTLKYVRIDPALRDQKRYAWNKPVVWPAALAALLLLLSAMPAVMAYRRREQAAGVGTRGSSA